MSSLSLAAELWSAVKESIISSDRASVADTVIAMLIDHDVSAEEIRREFRGDGDIIEALKYYSDLDAESWDEIDEDETDDYGVDYRSGDDDDDEW
jgi:hypothetical protein